MRIIRTILLVAVAIFIVYVKLNSVPTTGGSNSSSSAPGLIQPSGQPQPAANEAVPPKALQVLQTVRTTGQPPDGYVGGRVFENREGRLPTDGDYREFDVDPHNGNRNAERLIVEWKTKKAWYTGDHYQTFIPMP